MGHNREFSPEMELVQRRLKLVERYKINLLLDVGASTGWYAQKMRKMGYRHRIISFEPLSNAFKKLKENAGKDPNWRAENIALGNMNGNIKINVAGNSVSSSILSMLPVVTSIIPQAAYTGWEEVEIYKLDRIFDQIYKPGDSIFLKIDTQGYEKQILKGGRKSLKKIKGLQIESSLVPLYRHENLLGEMLRYTKKLGYSLMSIEPGFNNPETGQLLQVDLIFFRNDF